MRRIKTLAAGGLVASMAAAGLAVAHADTSSSTTPPSSTPIKHVVVIFGENESFDHYFGTYPNAANPAGEPTFTAKRNTPAVNGLTNVLLNSNPNSANPRRLDRNQAVTCDQGHGYTAEQKAFDGGLMDRFVENTAGGSCTDKSIVMDYYDGNTVTGLWNLAQNFSMSDNSYSTAFGPSSPGAVNLISGQTHGAIGTAGVENNTLFGDADPRFDDCGAGQVQLTGKNVGDLLNAHNLTWGWFQGGFAPTRAATSTTPAQCGEQHANVAGGVSSDYSSHHEPFMYYQSTANPHHLPPTSAAMIGRTDQANHQYDLTAFDTALENNDLPAVSFLKAAAFEDAHPGNSDPLDEQRFVDRTIDDLENSPEWSSTAVIIAYDDSDGWYDHQMSPIVNASGAPSDALNGPGVCGNSKVAFGDGTNGSAYNDRCGYGPRQPLLVISPYAKQNYVDHTITDQTSVLRFIEDNWQLGQIGDQSMDARADTLGNMFDFSPTAKRAPKVFLDPTTGEVEKKLPVNTPLPSGAVPSTDSGKPASTTPGSTPTNPTNTTPTSTATTPTTTTPASTTPVGTPPAGGSKPSKGSKPAKGTKAKTAQIKVKCTTKGNGKKVSVSCTVTGKDAKVGKTALRFRIVKGSNVLATSRAMVSKGRAASTLKAKKTLRGKYTLRIAIAHSTGAAASEASTIKL